MFQFYMSNPVRVFHCLIRDALSAPHIEVLDYVSPETDRSLISPVPMPLSILRQHEREAFHESVSADQYSRAQTEGLDENQRLALGLRDTDHAAPHEQVYQRGAR